MWSPTFEQAARAVSIGDLLHSSIPEDWDFASRFDKTRIAEDCYQPSYRRELHFRPPGGPWERSAARLRAFLPEKELEQSCADYLFFPTLTREGGWSDVRRSVVEAIAVGIASSLVPASDYAVDVLSGRIRHMLQHVFEGTEDGLDYDFPRSSYRAPNLHDCLNLLVKWRDHPAALPVIEEIVHGRLNAAIRAPDIGTLLTASNNHWKCTGAELRHSYRAYSGALSFPMFDLLATAAERGRLDRETFRRAVLSVQLGFPAWVGHSPYVDRDCPPLQELAAEWAWEIVQELSPGNLALIGRFIHRPVGARWLVKGCEHVEARGLTAVPEWVFDAPLPALRWLIGVEGLDPTDDPAAVVERLRAFTPATLAAVLPGALAARELVMKALGWQAAIPLLHRVQEVARRKYRTYEYMDDDIPNSPDPESGVVPDRENVRRIAAAAPPAVVKKLFKALRGATVKQGPFSTASDGYGHSCTLVEAILGWTRDKIVKDAARHVQIALKGLGLLPIERGADEVLERYRALRQAQKDSSKYGTERAANTRAAAAVGLVNLASNAGYRDESRLEWAMEARLAQDVVPVGVPFELPPYALEIRLEGRDVRLVASKNGRALASIPPAVRRSPEHVRLREAAAAYKGQAARYRRSLEDGMVHADVFEPADLRDIASSPLGRALLLRLVLRGVDGRYGLLESDTGALSTLDGETLAPQPVSIPHVRQMDADGVLGRWQDEVVRRRIVQPFKQVFRESYVREEAAPDARAEERRFVGQRLASGRARRLLESRGWLFEGGDIEVPFRWFPRLKIRAVLDVPDAGHVLHETGDVTTGPVVFQRDVVDENGEPEFETVLWRDVPPEVYSEVMRDVDLVVSVASLERLPAWSAESARRRRELLRGLLADASFAGIAAAGDHAEVAGRLARYRVHLGSGAASIEPGGHDCTPPELTADEVAALFIPFAEQDLKTGQVLGRILRLASDETIDDPLFGAQLEAARAARGID
jgi:hypothetical protein